MYLMGFVLCTTTFAEPVNKFISFENNSYNAEELWQQFYNSEANKRLIDIKLEPIREEIKYIERFGIIILLTLQISAQKKQIIISTD